MTDTMTLPVLPDGLTEAETAIIEQLAAEVKESAAWQIRKRLEDVAVRLSRSQGWCDTFRMLALRVLGTPRGVKVPMRDGRQSRREFRDSDGIDCWGYDVRGWLDGYGPDGFNVDGIDRNGYNRDGVDKDGRSKWRFDESGYDRDGFASSGFNRDGYDRDGFRTNGRDSEGYDREGFNRNGFNRDGFNADGFDRYGADANGLDMFGLPIHRFNPDGYDSDGYDRHGYHRANGDRRLRVR